jgi:hypothetical protein
MNARRFLSVLPLSVLVALSSCDKDSKVFDDSDLATERSIVTGRVTGIGDSGLVGVVVTATAVNDQGAPLKDVAPLTGLTGREGRYSLELRPGLRWKISWQSLDYQATNKEKTVDLGLRETRELPVQRLTYRYGVIAGRTLPGANVAVEGQDVAGKADAQGDFRLERVAPGPVEIVGTLRGKGAWRIADSVKPEDTSSVSGRSQVASWKPLCGIAGTIVNQDGIPQAGAVVSAMGGLVRDTTDIQGRFSFDAVPAKGRVALSVQRTTGALDRIVVSTPPEDSTWDLGQLVVTGSVTASGLTLANTLVVADSGDLVSVPLLWKLLDSTRSVIGFAWDTTGTGSTAKALRTWGPRLAAWRLGGRDRTISVWACMAAPLSGGGFDTLWSQEATIRVQTRRKPAPLDSLPAPEFSQPATGDWDAPLNIGLSSSIEKATILWSRDSADAGGWGIWSPDDSITLYDTTTIWAMARLARHRDSRIVRRTFNVREPAKPAELQAKITANYTLPQGSRYQASECPELSANVTFVLDSGATLKLPEGCGVTVDNGATFEMRAGSTLIMGRGAHFYVGSSTTGKLVVKGRVGRRARMVSADPANPPGFSSDYLVKLLSNSSGSRIQGLDIDGSSGDGIQLSDVEVDILDSRIRNCKGAGIRFLGDARPATDSGVRNDSISGCRWSVDASPYALGRVATNPGFSDTVRIYDGTNVAENSSWKRQKLPLRAEAGISVEDQSTLDLEAGLVLRMGASAHFYVKGGVLNSRGTRAAPVRLEPANRTLGWGFGDGAGGYGIKFTSTGTGEFRWTEIVGTNGNGVLADGPVGMFDSRLDSNKYAGILFAASGRTVDDTSFARIIAKGNRWSLAIPAAALKGIATCPGFSDSILLTDDGSIAENNVWRSQRVPFVINGFGITIDGDASVRIDSGNTFVFGQGGHLYVGSGGGSLVVDGTSAHPVRFLARTVAGWGFSPASTTGYAIRFLSGTTAANLSHLVLEGAQSNGILFSDTQNGVGKLVSVTVKQTAKPTASTYGLRIEGDAAPEITDYDGTCSLDGGVACPAR